MKVEKRGFEMRLPYEEVLSARENPLNAMIRTSIKAATIGAHRNTSGHVVSHPSAEDIAEWEAADVLYQQLRKSRFWDDGYDGGLAERPAPRRIPVYSESEEEFAERVDREYATFVDSIENKGDNA